MTKLLYLSDSYQRTCSTKVESIRRKGQHWEVILTETIFYPQGGGQASDKGKIIGRNGNLVVTHVRMHGNEVIHEGKLVGKLSKNEVVECEIDWNLRWKNMQLHSSGHVIHETINQLIHGLIPIKGHHDKNPYIEYQGVVNPKLAQTIEKQTNMMVAEGKDLNTEMVDFDEIVKRKIPIHGQLPKNKPLRLLTIDGCPPIPDGGTQVKNTNELGFIKILKIENIRDQAKIFYTVDIPLPTVSIEKKKISETVPMMSIANFKSLILEMAEEIKSTINKTPKENLEQLKIAYFGSHGKATNLIKHIKDLPLNERKSAGMLVNQFKQDILAQFLQKPAISSSWFDPTIPGIPVNQGHLHLVTQAIMEITEIFNSIGFTRVRYPEVDWDWYAFESLNMPEGHPARDEWETFHIDSSKFEVRSSKLRNIVLTPHTSNSQVREMEKKQLPIKMINIAKCFRRQMDISHTPMFHQFEGLYIDRAVSIGHLKGVCDYFFKRFYDQNRISRLRPFHFQFTEPSFEIDVSCGICNGTGKLNNRKQCKLCKEGWVELGGAGMVHPKVIENAGLDPRIYNGFAFGWGVERTYMMKAGTQIDDIRLIYGNDIRFLEQF